jgi:hypothetical protein
MEPLKSPETFKGIPNLRQSGLNQSQEFIFALARSEKDKYNQPHEESNKAY